MMTTTSKNLKTFTKFPDLPIELRREIWRMAILELDGYHHRSIIELQIRNNTVKPTSPTHAPFNPNREARQESFFLAGESMTLSGYETAGGILHFDPKLDTLYINNELCQFGHLQDYMYDRYLQFDEEHIGKTTRALRILAKSLSDTDRSKIQNLAIEVEASMYGRHHFNELNLLERDLVQFQGLSSLTVIMSFGYRSWGRLEDIVFVETTLGQDWQGPHQQNLNACAQRAKKAVTETFDLIKRMNSTWRVPSLRVVCIGLAK
jgi:hypothetical protein